MTGGVSEDGSTVGHVTLRYWASARSEAGVAEERFALDGPVDLAWLVSRAGAGRDRLARVLSTCSVLIGDRPVASADPASVRVQPGDVVEFLPPFAGG